MYSTIRLTVFVLVCAMVFSLPQTVFSQEDNPDLQKGILDYRQESYEEALDSFLKARESVPKSPVAAYFLGITYKNLQNYQDAEQHLKDAISLSPKVKEAVLELAEVQLQLEEFNDALATLAIAEKEDIRPGQTAFLKGLVLMKKNRNLAAVESFEKAKDLNPELAQTADYQIGLAYLKEGDFPKAEGRFSEVIVRDPNTDMAAFASQYKDAIEKRKKEGKPVTYSLGLHFQYDDNVILKPGDVSAVGLAGDIGDEDDYREVLTFGLNYIPQRRGKWSTNAQYSLYLSNHHSLETHDVNSHTFVLVPSYKINDKSTLNVVLSDNHIWVNGDQYLNTASISPTYVHKFKENQTYQTSVSYQKKEFLNTVTDPNEDRDANKYAFDFSWFYLFPEEKGYLNLSYKLSKEDTDGLNWDHIENRGAATVFVPLHEKYDLSVSGEVKYQDFENNHATYSVQREDTTYTISSVLAYDLYKSADLQFLYAHINDDSNIALYDYDRNIYSVGVEWDF